MRLVSDDSLAESFGQAFYRRAEKNFSDVEMARTHKNIYEKIVKENKQ